MSRANAEGRGSDLQIRNEASLSLTFSMADSPVQSFDVSWLWPRDRLAGGIVCSDEGDEHCQGDTR